MSRDVAGRMLDAVVGLLPRERHDWGHAMRAELSGIESRRERWSFAAGCAAAVVRQPAALGRIGYALLVLATAAAFVAEAATVSYGPLRAALAVVAGALIGVSALGRRAGVLGPVRSTTVARMVRAGGYVVIGLLTVTLLHAVTKSNDHPAEDANTAVVFLVVLTTFLVGFLALTADRSAATDQVLRAGIVFGVAAPTSWSLLVLIIQPIPTDITSAVAALGAGMVAAAVAAGLARGEVASGLLAGLFGGVVGSLVTFLLVAVMSSFGPDSLIPDIVGAAALTPADSLAQSRHEIQDPYVWVVAFGFLMAGALGGAAIATLARRRHRVAALSPQ